MKLNNNKNSDSDDSIEIGDSVSTIGNKSLSQNQFNARDELFKVNKKILILTNFTINNENDMTILMVYAENLVPNNIIENITASKLFKNTFYIKFRNLFEFNNVLIRHKRRPSIRENKIEILEAYNTNSIVGAFENNGNIKVEVLEFYFGNKNKSGVDKFLKLKKCSPFVVIQFFNQEQVNTVLGREQKISNVHFVSENFYNPKLVPSYE